MSWIFNYQNNNNNNKGAAIDFTCELKCVQCAAMINDKKQCAKTVCIGLYYCWYHSETILYLKIIETESMGKGLFAYDRTRGKTETIFKKDQVICNYNGQFITEKIANARYGQDTAPYAVRDENYGNQYYDDAACYRGIGSLANQSIDNYNAEIELGNNFSWCLKAVKDIPNNTQIFLNYGEEYDMNDKNIKFSTNAQCI